MNLKYIDNLNKVSDKSILTVIEAIQRRLDKNIDNAETRALLVERQEVLIMEAEKRGLADVLHQ
jgi:hypothetical protein